jgi:hypothetical protein
MEPTQEFQKLLASKGLTTVRFKAFLLESRDPDAAFHSQAKRYEAAVLDLQFHPRETKTQGEFVAAVKEVEQAYEAWQEAEDE